MLQHASVAPDLSRLPVPDRYAVGKALAKNPAERFASCAAFIASLASIPPRQLSLIAQPPKGDTSRIIATPPPRLVTPQSVNSSARKPNGGEETTRHTSLGATSTASSNATPQNNPQPIRPQGPKVPKILSVLPVGWLRGREAPDPDLSPREMVRAILAAATATTEPDVPPGIAQLPDGTWWADFSAQSTRAWRR